MTDVTTLDLRLRRIAVGLIIGFVAAALWIVCPQVPKLAVPFIRTAMFLSGAIWGWFLRYFIRPDKVEAQSNRGEAA